MAETHHLAITSNKKSDYEFRTAGAKLTPHSMEGPDELTHNGTGARGRVWGGTDGFTINGPAEFETFDPGQSATITLDGKPVSGKELRSRSGSGSSGDTTNDASGSFDPDIETSDRNLTPTYGCVDRPLMTARDRTVTVGRGEDVGTVQGFLNSVPRFVEHELIARPTKGVHGHEPGNSLNVYPSVTLASTGKVFVVGDTANPRDYVLDVNQCNIQTLVGTGQDVSFQGVHIKGTVQNRVGNAELKGCVISPGNNRWGSGDPVAIDTYGGHLQVIDTAIESEHAAINLVENASVSLNANCSVAADGPLCSSGQGGGELILGGDVDLSSVSQITTGWEPGLVRVMDGHGVTKGLDTGKHAVIQG